MLQIALNVFYKMQSNELVRFFFDRQLWFMQKNR